MANNLTATTFIIFNAIMLVILVAVGHFSWLEYSFHFEQFLFQRRQYFPDNNIGEDIARIVADNIVK